MTLDELLALPKGHKTVQKYLQWGIIYEATYLRRRERDQIKKTSHRVDLLKGKTPSEVISNAFAEYETTILQKWLVEGIPLGKCTPEMLINAAKNEEAKANGHILNATFYREIASKGKKGKPIAETISIDRIETIRVHVFGHMKTLEPAQ